MQPERQFLQSLINTINLRCSTLEHTPSNPKLLRAYEIRNRVVYNLRDQLVEILGKDDAYEMINEAEKDAEKWWEGRENNQKQSCNFQMRNTTHL